MANDFKFRFTLTSSGANRNGQVFVEDELMFPEVYRSPIGQPIDEDHDQNFRDIVGEIYDSWFEEAVPGIRRSRIRCRGVILAPFTDVIAKVACGAGRWAAVSMEAQPNPLEKVGNYLIIRMPIFVGAGLVRYPGCEDAHVDEVDGEPVGARLQAASANKIIVAAGIRQLLG